jgi:hypothetical protein
MSEFSFTDMLRGALDWANANPGLAGAGLAGIGTLLDPARAPTYNTTQRVSLPDYAAPYVNRMLNRFEGLSQEDYMPYSGPRVQDFNQDQQAAFDRFRNMQAMTPMQQQGSGIVGAAAEQLLGAGNQRFDQSQADFYMSPYMQSVVDIQLREAQRDFDRQMPVLNAAAVRAGAFGGDRQAILQAEAQRNLNQRLGDIQAQGSQAAFTNAQGQFNADMGRMSGNLTGAATAGNTLAGIGQQNFQNQLATNQNLLGIGNQQQALGQRGLDVGYQNFLDQRNHPYQQAQFMQQGLQGLPMTQTATAQVGSAPTLTQQLISAGIGGYQLGSGRP